MTLLPCPVYSQHIIQRDCIKILNYVAPLLRRLRRAAGYCGTPFPSPLLCSSHMDPLTVPTAGHKRDPLQRLCICCCSVGKSLSRQLQGKLTPASAFSGTERCSSVAFSKTEISLVNAYFGTHYPTRLCFIFLGFFSHLSSP